MRISWLFVNGALFGRCISAPIFLITLFWYLSIGHWAGACLIVGWAQERSIMWLTGYYTESGMPKAWFPDAWLAEQMLNLGAQHIPSAFARLLKAYLRVHFCLDDCSYCQKCLNKKKIPYQQLKLKKACISTCKSFIYAVYSLWWSFVGKGIEWNLDRFGFLRKPFGACQITTVDCKLIRVGSKYIVDYLRVLIIRQPISDVNCKGLMIPFWQLAKP